MRVTQSMLSNNMLRNLSKSYSDVGTYMDQLSTGKKINKPSDDPVIAMKGMNYRSQVTEIEQFQRNVSEVYTWMDSSESALDKATQAMQRLRELTVQASNDTYDIEQRKNIAQEVDQLHGHLIDIANTKVNDRYIFNGTKTDTPPVVDGEVDLENLGGPVMIEVASNSNMKVNVDPGSVFNNEMFEQIKGLSDQLRSEESGNISDSLTNIENQLNQVISARSDLGARINRLELVENRLSEQEVTATRLMSDNEDADIEKVITNLQTQESVHRAALSAGSRIIQPSLLDFLR